MCKPCNGKKVQKEKKKLKIEIDKGAPNGERYTIHGEADEIPGAEAGDVIIQIKEKPNKTFHRKGADLIIEKEISLIESLTGLDFVLTHLDGKKYRIKNTPGEVIKHDDLKTVEHLGMPLSKKTYAFGNLFIHFKVKFPASIDAKHVALI
jgi:DnaJ family protein A protein 2